MKFAPMATPAMALLQQHDTRRDTLIEPAAQRHAAIEARGIQNWGRNRAVKTNQLVLYLCHLNKFEYNCKPGPHHNITAVQFKQSN